MARPSALAPLAAALLAAAVVAPSASAAVVSAPNIATGPGSPVLADDGAVFARLDQTGMHTAVLDRDGGVRTLRTTPYPNRAFLRPWLAASGRTVAVLDDSGLWARGPSGWMRVDPGCHPEGNVDVDGTLVAWIGSCPSRGKAIYVRDVAGSEPPAVVEDFSWLTEVRIAGRFLAWHRWRTAQQDTPGHDELVVFDRVERRVVYRVSVPDLVGATPPCTHDRWRSLGCEWGVNHDLEPDGSLVVAYARTKYGPGPGRWEPGRLAWFSPESPVAHPIPAVLGDIDLAAAQGLVAVKRREPGGVVVVDRQGNVVDRVHPYRYPGIPPGDLAFDGRRIAWATGGHVFLGDFPVSAPALADVQVTTSALAFRVSQPARLTVSVEDCRAVVRGRCRGARLRGRMTRAVPPGPRRLRLARPLAAALRRPGLHRLSVEARNRTGARSRVVRIVRR